MLSFKDFNKSRPNEEIFERLTLVREALGNPYVLCVYTDNKHALFLPFAALFRRYGLKQFSQFIHCTRSFYYA